MERKGKRKEEVLLYFYHKDTLFIRRLVLRTCQEGVLLLLDTGLLSLSSSLGPGSLGVHLLLKYTLTCLLGLSLVDVLDQRSLMLEGVALAQMIELVVEVLIDLSGGAVLDEKTTENAETAHP